MGADETMARALAGRPGRLLPWVVGLCLTVGLLGYGAPGRAQEEIPPELREQAQQLMGGELSDRQILELLRQSGLTPSQIRDRLEARGLPRDAADAWLSVLEGRASQVPEGTNPAPLVRVLAGTRAGRRAGLDTARLGRVPTDSLRREPEFGPPVFGRQIFRRATSQFEPVTTGPVPPDYRVGPDDQLILVLTGAVEKAYELRVSNEGWVVIPEVGRVFVNGRTMAGLRDVLFNRLAGAYSSLRGESPSTQFDITLGELRTNQLYVIGEVEQPAAYTVSSLATALTALYHAGGPTRSGSFREIRVNRGGETVRTIDLYAYLLEGRSDQDIRLQQGDIIFVPPADKQVQVQGPVTRPAIYELAEGETLRDLLRFAGGVEPNADLKRVQIHRVLPPAERAPGRDRTVVDVPVGDLEAPVDLASRIPLRDGDRIQVFALLDEARNRVTVSGAVWRPGTYGAAEETRLWDVIEAAGGLLPDVYQGRAQIQRLDEDSYTRRMVSVRLARDSAGRPVENPRVRGMDQVFVYAKRKLREHRAVSIGGWVREPGVYPFVEGMTVADLILQAGGLRTGVYTAEAEVARPVISQTERDTLTRRHTVALDSSYVFDSAAEARARMGGARPNPGGTPVGEPGDTARAGSSAGDGASGETAADVPAVERFELRNMDAVHVRKAPGFERPRRVVITGEVRFPGPYTLQRRDERVADVVRRAGGLTEEAYAGGFELWRAVPEAERIEADSLASDRERLRLRADSMRLAAEGRLDTLRRPLTAQDSLAILRDSLAMLKKQLPQDSAPALRDSLARQIGMLTGDVERQQVGIEFTEVLDEPESSENVILQPGDSLHVPGQKATVLVRGAVGVEATVLHREGAGLDYYIDRAGGFAADADEDRVRVRYANGQVEAKGGGFLFFGGGVPDPDPGSVVTVPAKPPRLQDGFEFSQLIPVITAVVSGVTTIVVATN